MNLLQFICNFTLLIALVSAVAEKCNNDKCKIENNCKCTSNKSPIENAKTPKFVVITIDDAVQTGFYENYYKPLLNGRKNADGSPISATYFVPHQYTNYIVVNELYNMGMEIGSNSITKNYSMDYWLKASTETLVNEFAGQREIIAKFANIPEDSITGVRIPNLLMNGDTTIKALIEAGFHYDNSWPTLNDALLWPYTLDYASTQSCLVAKCPKESYPGFWEVPINDLLNFEKQNCNYLIGCVSNGTVDEIKDWLLKEFGKTYTTDKAPFNLLLNAGWFSKVDNALEAMKQFLDELNKQDDVYIVSNKQLLDWMHNPEPLGTYKPKVEVVNNACTNSNCKLAFGDSFMYMGSCVDCPPAYPWIGNTAGNE